MKKTVKDLAGKLANVKIYGDQNRLIADITHDSRQSGEGILFVCIPGAHVDGHDFASQAAGNGAVAILAERKLDLPAEVTQVIVPDVKVAMQSLVPYFYDYPGQKLRMIGVTGTNGKTTITYLLRSILRNSGYKVGLIGTIQIMIEDDVLPIHNTTPDVIDLQKTLAKMRESGITHVIMEVSSHALAQQRVAGCEFDTAVFTNLTQDHLDYHKTMENYALAKALLFDNVSASTAVKQNKAAVINMDDEAGKLMLAHSQCSIITTYGIDYAGDLRATAIDVKPKGVSFNISGEFGSLTLNLKITGIFNVYNVMGAVGAALAEGISPSVIKQALEASASVPGRFELVDCQQNFAVIVDYAHTPDGLENILKTARQITSKRIITVFGCGGDRDRTKRPIMGRIAAELSDVVIATSDNPRSEDPEFILSQVEAGVLPALTGDKQHEKITDRRQAIERAIKIAKSGDTVVIAGKGHENYQILKEKTIHFDDKEVASEAIRGLK